MEMVSGVEYKSEGIEDTLDMTFPLKHGIIIVTGYVPP